IEVPCHVCGIIRTVRRTRPLTMCRKCAMNHCRETGLEQLETKSGYRGVNFQPDHLSCGRPWRMTLRWRENGKTERWDGGYFPDAESAALAYDAVAKARWGSEAVLNFPKCR